MTEYKKRWRRAAGGAIAGSAVAGGLLLSGSTPTLARDVPAGVVARTADPSGTGYWVTDPLGDVYGFGNALNYGSMAGKHLNAPIVGIVAAPDGKGYWLVGKDGGVFAFGSARFLNSMPGVPISIQTIVGMAAVPEPSSTGGVGPPGPSPSTIALSAYTPGPRVLTGMRQDIASVPVRLTATSTLMATATGVVLFLGTPGTTTCQLFYGANLASPAQAVTTVTSAARTATIALTGSWANLPPGPNVHLSFECLGPGTFMASIMLNVWGGP